MLGSALEGCQNHKEKCTEMMWHRLQWQLVSTTCEQHCCMPNLFEEPYLPHSLLLFSHGHRMFHLYAKHHLGVCCQNHALGLRTKCMKFAPAPVPRLQTLTYFPITASCNAIAFAVRVASQQRCTCSKQAHVNLWPEAPGSIMTHIMSSQEAPSRIGSHKSSMSILP